MTYHLHKHCLELVNLIDQVIYPSQVNEISINMDKLPFLVNDPGYGRSNIVFICQNHVKPNKSWQILSKFIYFSPVHEQFIVPIVTSQEMTLPMNEVLDHISIYACENIYQFKQGNKKHTYEYSFFLNF